MIVVHHIITERTPQHRRAIQLPSRVAQGFRDLTHALRRIEIALHLGFKFQLALNPVQTGGEQRSTCQIGVHIRAWNAALDPDSLGPLTANAEPCGAIVTRPDDFGRREKSDAKALIAVDVRGKENRHLLGSLQLPGDEMFHKL